MQVENIPVDNITVPSRLRAVDTAKVARLAESIEALGLQSPITVWAKPDDAFHIVAGAHRLAAAKSLGWEWIDAFFMEADEIDRQLWEIDENLMRSELTPTQMAEHLAKRKELWEARKESGTTCSTLTGRGNKQFASDTADKTGASKQQINRSVARAEKVSEDIRDEIRGTELDKGTVLDDLARTPREQQRARLDEWRDGRKSKVDADVKAQAAHAVAEIIAESTPPDLWDGIKANLYAAGAANIANELTNIIGGSLMDKGGWG